MPDLKQEITYEQPSGLNYDDDFRFMGKGDSEYRLNIIPNSFGNTYVITNMLGNTQHEHTFTHGSAYGNATYTCIGSCYDVKRDASYLFISSDHGNDSIIRFNFDDNSFDKIVWDHTGIDLDSDYPITDAFMIGDWLHFNPRSTSPRVLNVQWAYYDHIAYELKAGGGDDWSVGDYVKENNKVYQVTEAFDNGEQILIDHPNKATFVDWTYQDVDTVPDSATYGEYNTTRDFYNVPIWPTLERPYTAYGSDTGVDSNNIRGNIFQFAFRFYVPKQGYTIAASFSDMVANANDETWTGEDPDEITTNNYIEVGFNVGDASGNPYLNSGRWLFEFVDILFRENANTEWKVADRIYHDDACTYATNLAVTGIGSDAYICRTKFYNDRSYEVVDSAAIEKPYTPLPILAKAQWALGGERSAYGGITEGRNSIVGPLEIALTANTREVSLQYSTTGGDTTTYSFDETQISAPHRTFYTYTTSAVISSLPTGTTPWYIVVNIDGSQYYGSYDGGSVSDFIDAMIEVLNQASGITSYKTGSDEIEFTDDQPHSVNIVAYDTSSSTYEVSKFKTFKSNAKHPFCLYYYDDALRRSDPQTQADYSTYSTNVFIPSLPDDASIERGTNYQHYMSWAISHDAPSWASYWRLGYAGNQSIDRDRHWQYNIEGIEEKTSGDWSGYIEIDISGLQELNDENATHDNFLPNSRIPAYDHQPGDRVKFVTAGQGIYATSTTTATTSEAVDDYADIWIADPNHDFEIKAYDDVNYKIYIDADALDDSELAGYADTPNQVLVEIYTLKKKSGPIIYHEIGQLYQVYSSGDRYFHRGQTQDQTAAQSATGSLNSGDAYLIPRIFANAPFSSPQDPLFVESFHWSDFYDSNTWGKGKPGYISGIGQKYANDIRYSNRYQPVALTSGLSEFDFLDKISLSTEHGDIVAMRQVGDALKVYFERNTAAVLVNKTEYFDASGQSQVVTSDRALGSVRYSNYHYGTIFPESVLLRDRTVYFYDIYRDTFLRDSANGLEPISDYKMRRYFDEKSLALRSSGVDNIQVWTAYDYEYDMVYVHFIDSVDSSNDEVILFHEPQNRWVTFLQIADTVTELITTTTSTSSTSTSSTSTSSTSTSTSSSTHGYDTGLIFGRGSMKLVSFIGEDVYTHNDNTTRNNFWGDQRSSIIHVVANEAANVKKTYEALAIHSNKPWDVEDIKVAVDPTYEYGMVSKVPESRFVLREGIYRSDYLRNMRTNQATSATLDLVRGEHLRGYYIIHRLVNDDTDEVRLFKVDVLSNVSRI